MLLDTRHNNSTFQIFTANNDTTTKVTNYLLAPPTARLVRLEVLTYDTIQATAWEIQGTPLPGNTGLLILMTEMFCGGLTNLSCI